MTHPHRTAALMLANEPPGEPEADRFLDEPVPETKVDEPAATKAGEPIVARAQDVRALALKHGPEAIAALVKIINAGTSEASRIAAAQEENARHMASIRTLREDAHKMRNQLTKLQGFAEALFRHIAVLERQIVGLGAEPALRPSPPEL